MYTDVHWWCSVSVSVSVSKACISLYIHICLHIYTPKKRHIAAVRAIPLAIKFCTRTRVWSLVCTRGQVKRRINRESSVALMWCDVMWYDDHGHILFVYSQIILTVFHFVRYASHFISLQNGAAACLVDNFFFLSFLSLNFLHHQISVGAISFRHFIIRFFFSVHYEYIMCEVIPCVSQKPITNIMEHTSRYR